MLPRRPAPTTTSAAELVMFDRIEEGAPDSWTALHSLGLNTHTRKPVAEADFVLVAPDGILVLEVKGGRITRSEREWRTNGKPLKESPFDQAAGAASALFTDLAAAVPAVRQSFVGHGVCFPDVRFELDGTDTPPELVYDHRDGGRPFFEYAERLFEYWRSRTSRRDPRPLSPKDIDAVVRRLAIDFDLVPTLGGEVEDVVRSLVRLTEEQSRVFHNLAANPRVFVTGSAGTGKTVLAAAEASRLAGAGQRVLFLCHSNALAASLSEKLAGEPLVDVYAFHAYAGQLIRDSGVADPRPRDGSLDEEYFRVLRPLAALEGLEQMEVRPNWDALIVDEAQDLMTEAVEALLDAAIIGGMKEGTWRLFADPEQDVFSASEEAVIERLTQYATRWALTTNCRNTRQIAMHTAIASRTKMAEVQPLNGPDVSWVRYRDADEQLDRIVEQLRAWREEGLDASQIVILSERRRENSVLAGGLPRGTGFRMTEGPTTEDSGAVRFCTVAGFKGLEANAILFIDPSLDASRRRSSVYVGMTRARAALVVMRPVSSDQRWEQLQSEFAERAFGPR